MATHDPDLCWRVERACAEAWPPVQRDEIAGWAVRRSGGGTRRINSASALTASAGLDAAVLATVERAYAAVGAPAIWRLTDLHADVAQILDEAGYAPAEGSVRTLHRAAGGAMPRDPRVTLAPRPDAAWLRARRDLSIACGAAPDAHTAPAGRVAVPACFAALAPDGDVGSVGFAALHDGIAVIEAVATAPDRRRQGHAAALVGALLAWSTQAGAHGVALQVEEANGAARAL